MKGVATRWRNVERISGIFEIGVKKHKKLKCGFNGETLMHIDQY